MSSQPFFSVVIPTYKRPHYLHDAIYSVLNQDFTDLECIVSDNCNGHETQQVVNQFRSDSRLRVVRPDKELGMPDHWEFATKHAEGKWVLVLADRKVYRQNALGIIKTQVELHPHIKAGSFGVRVFKDIEGRMGWIRRRFKTKVFSSTELIKNFLNESVYIGDTIDPVFPKTLNGFYSNAHAANIRKTEGCYFSVKDTVSPDFSSFFINAAMLDSSLHIGQQLMLTQGEHLSHGRNFSRGSYQYYMSTLESSEPYSQVPLKAPFLTTFLMQDFLVIRSLFNGNLSRFEPNWKNYFVSSNYELERKMKSGLLTEQDKAEFNASFEAAIGDTSYGYTRAQVLEWLGTKNTRQIQLSLTSRIKGYLEHHYSHLRAVNSLVKYRFPNALKAAGF